MNVTITKGAKIAGVSRNTIYKDIENGMLSVSTNARGKTLINIAELERVYGPLNSGGGSGQGATSSSVEKRPKRPGGAQPEQIAVLQERIESLKKQEALYERMLDEQKNRHDEAVERLESQVENQTEQIQSFRLLIEDQRKKDDTAGQWEQAMTALEERIANQLETKEREAEERLEQLALFLA